MVDLRGLEPLTSAMRMLRSSQLSYRPSSALRQLSKMVGDSGVEPLTSSTSTMRSNQLS